MTDNLSKVLTMLRGAEDGDRIKFALRAVLDELIKATPNIQATRHPLGFTHLELTEILESRPGERVRLHIWPSKDAGDSAGNVHDHTWDLTSIVLFGELHDRDFSPRSTPDGPYRGSRVTYGDVNAFDLVGRYHLDEVRDRRVTAGHVYKVPPRIVHESEVVSVPTVTMVLAHEARPASDPGPMIFSKDGVPVGTSVRPKLPQATLRAELRELRRQLSAQGA